MEVSFHISGRKTVIASPAKHGTKQSLSLAVWIAFPRNTGFHSSQRQMPKNCRSQVDDYTCNLISLESMSKNSFRCVKKDGYFIARDRAIPILTAVNKYTRPQDPISPGCVFRLRARSGGVLVRVGQTEGSADIARPILPPAWSA